MGKVKTIGQFSSVIFTIIAAYLCFFSQISKAINLEDEMLKSISKRYCQAEHLRKFTIDYQSQSIFAPQSYDYHHPGISKRQQITDIDLDKNHYFSQVIRGPFPGNYIFDTSEFQRDDIKVRYDNNYVLYGKQVLERDTDNPIKFEIEELNMVVDVLAVAELFATPMLEERLSIKEESDKVILSVTNPDNEATIYTFDKQKSHLIKVVNPVKNYSANFSHFIKKDGLQFASNVELINNGFQSEYTINQLHAIKQIAPKKLKIPMGYGPIISADELPIASEKISEDLYVLSNVDFDRFVVVKVNDDKLTVFGAPGKAASKKVINFLNELLPNKTIESVYITHPHSDHISGLPVYAKHGAVIIADQYTVDVIKSFPRFKNEVATFKFKVINNKSKHHGVTYYLPENSHAKGQSFVYFDESKIIYQGDLLEIPLDNTVPIHMSDTDREFIEFLYHENIVYSRIVGHHRNGNIAPSLVDQYYQHHHGQYVRKINNKNM